MSQISSLVLRTAAETDAEVIRDLLERCGLPTSDLGIARPEFILAMRDNRIIGSGALQRFGSAALLRSVAVEKEWRGSGVGRLIVAELERRALTAGVTELVLLTLTARDCFERLGYRAKDRAQVPAAVLDSTEFRSLCPTSAICLGKRLAMAI